MNIEKTIRKLADKLKPPCPKCPYTLGHVQFVKDPCFMCKLNDYNVYYELIQNGLRYGCPKGIKEDSIDD